MNMKLSTKIRYGTRLMLELGLHYGKGQTLMKDISKNQHISEKYLGQIIIPLKTAGLINAYRGPKGGFELSRAPYKITLKDIVEAVEGEIILLECAKDSSVCARQAFCPVGYYWKELGKHIESYLGAITLEEIILRQKSLNPDPLMYNI